ncbi:MAG: DinB family protein [Salinibacter sp.]
MHAQLDDYQSHFRSLKREAAALVDGTDEELLLTRPNPETWSVAEVFDHVNTAGWLLLPPLEEAIQDGHDQGPYGTPPFRYGVVSRWFVRSMRPSSSWTFTAPSVFEPEPPETLYPGETVEEFRALQDQFADCVAAAEGLDLRRIRVASPAVPLLRISLGAWFEATLAHEERHLEQARAVLDALPPH